MLVSVEPQIIINILSVLSAGTVIELASLSAITNFVWKNNEL